MTFKTLLGFTLAVTTAAVLASNIPDPSAASGLLQLATDMTSHAGDFFSSYADWEATTLSQTVQHSPAALKALVGFFLCIRLLLALTGVYVLAKARSVLSKLGR
ncbi:MAG: hypothetical protein HY741_29990 [Chloroflexi bacterium]|nr:hypothetical protein [Chloroflexota bacterium]